MAFTELPFGDQLKLYYKRFFPYNLYFRWLSYGDNAYFAKRELCFTLEDDIYVRYQSFSGVDDLEKSIQSKCPFKIDIGAVFSHKPKDHNLVKPSAFQAKERELVFDIDMNDYDDVRFCCTGAEICMKCWPLMNTAIKILNRALRDEFGFRHILWVYSGRRGVHCWVCDPSARRLPQSARSAIVEYLSVLKTGENITKKVTLNYNVHPLIRKSVDIIKVSFEQYAVEKQDFLGTPERYENVLRLIPFPNEQCETLTRNSLEECTNSSQRWKALNVAIDSIQESDNNSRKLQNVFEEIMLQFCYPRLDVNVTKGINHLLKSPFCVHPKTGLNTDRLFTGRVCVPIDFEKLDEFNPSSVPTIGDVLNELDKEKTTSEKTTETTPTSAKRRKTYEGALANSFELFKKFLNDLEESCRKERQDQKNTITSMEF